MKTPQKIGIIGNGNVGWHFQNRLKALDYQVVTFSSKDKHLPQIVQNADIDLLIICIQDAYYQHIIDILPATDKIIAHTSGSLDMNILQKTTPNLGVIYPFQTLTKGYFIDFEAVPLFIEASNSATETILQTIANKMSPLTRILSSQQRLFLHLSGCFASNFVNALYAAAAQILKEQNIDFELIKPLIKETCYKIETLAPLQAQTGPAKRKDKLILQKHLSLLKDTHLKNVYQIMSQLIDYQQNKEY
ncbi:MAG: DUF2520 domain-containing protein [Bacteroidales bacterium]|jgi:predicted short-subunit dehydrogenase-like oxidoreductase (DUF2520 family)|nr:DUF2520 domain-containing protein [Bacteroidales bacterium]